MINKDRRLSHFIGRRIIYLFNENGAYSVDDRDDDVFVASADDVLILIPWLSLLLLNVL